MDFILSRFNSFSLDTKGLSADNLFDKTKVVFDHIPDSKTLFVCLPGWGQKIWTWGRIRTYVREYNASCLIYEFPRAILADKHNLTEDCFNRINEEVRRKIQELKQEYGFTKVNLIALSLATSYASMVYDNNEDITNVVFIVPGENLARDMWNGCRTQHLRRSYEKQGINLEQLESYWKNLAPENHLTYESSKIYLNFGRNDKVIPCSLGMALVDRLKNVEVEVRNLGHYLSILDFLVFPGKYLTGIAREKR